MLYSNFVVGTIQPLQDKLSKDIKAFIEKALKADKIDKLHLANSMNWGLEIFDIMMKKDQWDLTTCLWIANEVGYPINLTAGGKLVNIISPGFAYRDLEKE